MTAIYRYGGEDRIFEEGSILKKGTLLSYDLDTNCLFNPVASRQITNPLVVSDILQKCTQLQCTTETSSKASQSTPEKKSDNVNHPAHYTNGSIECIDAMIAAYGKEIVAHFCQCNAFKYLWRFENKNKTEDLKKARWYLNKYLAITKDTE